jgi:hypothetical protein
LFKTIILEEKLFAAEEKPADTRRKGIYRHPAAIYSLAK